MEYILEDAAGLIQNKVSHGDCAYLGGYIGCPSESKSVPIYQKVAMPHIRLFARRIGKKIPERLKRFRDKVGEVSRNRRQGESVWYQVAVVSTPTIRNPIAAAHSSASIT